MADDERAIREVIETWHAATRAGESAKVLSLMADDVVFMVPGQAFGKKEFAQSFEQLQNVRIESKSEIEELRVLGDWAFCRAHLEVSMTPPGKEPIRQAGHTLSLFRRTPSGGWVLARDANLLTPKSD